MLNTEFLCVPIFINFRIFGLWGPRDPTTLVKFIHIHTNVCTKDHCTTLTMDILANKYAVIIFNISALKMCVYQNVNLPISDSVFKFDKF